MDTKPHGMTFCYEKDFRAAVRPGERYWVCGLRLNPAMTRRVKDVKPVQAEICVTGDGQDEAAARAAGRQPRYVVPLRPDGTPNWKRAMGPSDLYFYDNHIQCYSRYEGLVSEHARRMDAAVQRLKDFMAELRAGVPDYPDPPC